MSKKLLKRKDIIGVGVGYFNLGKPTKGATIILYTNQFAPTIQTFPSHLSAKVKGKILNIPIRVIKNKPFTANITQISSVYKKRIRPVRAGYSVGYANSSGTAGLIVTNNKNQLFICSNNHVLNKNNSKGVSETIQPGGADGGRAKKDRIGRLNRFVRLRKTNNYLDAATSIPIKNSLLDPRYPSVGTIPGHYKSYKVGWNFIKVGRTTGRVRGRVQSINTDVKVDYGGYGGLGEIEFKNQTVVVNSKPISLAGDSGSVWLRAKDRYATAVNFAGSGDGRISICFPIHWFMQVFKTRVARTTGGKGKVKKIESKISNVYTRPLSKKEMSSLDLV